MLLSWFLDDFNEEGVFPLDGGVPTLPSVEEAEEDVSLVVWFRRLLGKRNEPSGLFELGLEITGGDAEEVSLSLSSSRMSSNSADLKI